MTLSSGAIETNEIVELDWTDMVDAFDYELPQRG
jgi:hypothetical protein